MTVDVVHFNPLRRPPGLRGRFRHRRPLNNFGDLLGPLLVNRIVARRNLRESAESRRLLAVGSIMRLSAPGDVIWGAGINGKSMSVGAAPQLDVRAVRGPLTRNALLNAGAEVPEVFGDPALLWPAYCPVERSAAARRALTVIPNYNDFVRYSRIDAVVDPRSPLGAVLSAIVNSDFVVGTSLHAIVLADAFGVPARLIRSEAEPDFKYRDYFEGTGRFNLVAARSVEEALDLGPHPASTWDPAALEAAFPADLWIESRA